MRSSVRYAAAVLLVSCCAAAAAQSVDEMVVTGEFRSPRLDRLPASVSLLDGETITARGAHHLEEILSLAPNVNLAGGSSRARFFQIRGIGERGQFAELFNPSVGLLIDGVDLSDAATAATLFDVEQVEIFLGPQGTRYGANALAGLINIRTREPSRDFEASAGVELGDYDARTLRGAVSGPLGETLAWRLAGQHHTDDGFYRNAFLNRDDLNRRDEASFRGKLSWRPATNVEIGSMLGYVDVDNGYDVFSLDNNRITLSDEPGRDAQRSVLGSLHLRWEARPVILEAQLAGAGSDSVYGYDEDWTYVGFHPDEYSSTDYYFRDRRNVSGELRLLSRPATRLFNGRSDWAAGIYALDRSEDLRREYTFLSGPFLSRHEVSRFAVFGQLDSALNETTTLTTGLRYERQEARYDDSEGLAFSPSEGLIGWRVTLDRQLNRNLMVYAGVARGYKAGGFNTDGTLDADLRQYDAETLLNYELGLKGHFLENRLSASVSVFYMQRDDMQIASSITRTRPDGSSEFIEYVGNAAEGVNAGMEAELFWRPNERLALRASLGLLDSEYRSFINSAGEDLNGREQAHAPQYQFALGARYDLSGGWYVEAGAQGRDAFYFSDNHALRSRPYTLLDAAIGFERNDWSLRLWGRNLTDEDHAVRGYYFGNDPRIGYAERGYTQPGDPRQVGLSVTWSIR